MLTHRFSLVLALASMLAPSAWSLPAKAVCDVCHEGEEPVAATVVHRDHEHSFCSPACAEAFRKDPSKYHPIAAAPEADAHEGGSGSAAPSCPI